MNKDISKFFQAKPLYTYNESNSFLQKIQQRKQQQIEEQNKYKGKQYIPRQQTQNADNQYKGKKYDPTQTQINPDYLKQWLNQNRKQYVLEGNEDPVYIPKHGKSITLYKKDQKAQDRNSHKITMQLYNNKITEKHKNQTEQQNKRNLHKKLITNLATKLLKRQNFNTVISEQRIQQAKKRNQTAKLINLTTKLIKHNNYINAQNDYKSIKQQIQEEELKQNNEMAEKQREQLYQQATLPQPDYWTEQFKDYQDEQIQYSQQEFPENEDLAFRIIPQNNKNNKPNIQEIKQINQKFINQKLAWNYLKQLNNQFNNNLTNKIIKSFIYNNIVVQIYQPKTKYSKQYQSSQYKKQETLAISQITTSSKATNQRNLDRYKYKNWKLQITTQNINNIYILIEMLREYNIFSLKNQFQYNQNQANMQLYAPKGLHILELQQLINIIPGQIIIEHAEYNGQTNKYLIYYNIYNMTIEE